MRLAAAELIEAGASDREKLLRKYKPSYFDGTLLPRTVVLSDHLSDALRRARAESH